MLLWDFQESVPGACLTVLSVAKCRFFFLMKSWSFSTELHDGVGCAHPGLGGGRASKWL